MKKGFEYVLINNVIDNHESSVLPQNIERIAFDKWTNHRRTQQGIDNGSFVGQMLYVQYFQSIQIILSLHDYRSHCLSIHNRNPSV